MRSVAWTTLLTFRVDVPSDAFSVELRGSWDNFNHSYQLQRDQRRSPTNWVGIFTFKDIICDGDSTSPSEKREGCLRMGGTYWYHYIVNGVYECCDQAQPSTTRCPFLPGQDLNILDVPCEEAADALQDFVPQPAALTPAFTWNPQARFSTPRPNKFEALARKAQPPPPSPTYSSPVTPSCEKLDYHDFSSNSSAKRPSHQGSILTSPDEDSRPLSRKPSAHSNNRPWTSSDDNSMKSERMREKVNGLLRRARSLTSIARKISQKQKKRSSPKASHSPSNVPESIQEQAREDSDSIRESSKDHRVVHTSNGTVGCWAHQECWQSDESRSRACRSKEEDSTRHEKVASWVEAHEAANGDGFAYDDDAGLEPETNDGSFADQDEYGHALGFDSPDDPPETGYEESYLDDLLSPSQSPSSLSATEQPYYCLQLPREDEEDWRGYSDMFGPPQTQRSTGRRYGVAPQRYTSGPKRRIYNEQPQYPLPEDVNPLAEPVYYDDQLDQWRSHVDFENQGHSSGLEYGYEDGDQYYLGTRRLPEYQHHHGTRGHHEHFWGPDNWSPQNNLTADIARKPSVASFVSSARQLEEDASIDGNYAEPICFDEEVSESPCPEDAKESDDVSQEMSLPSNDGSWTNTTISDSENPVSRFNSILRRYRRTNPYAASVHTEEEDGRENNPSTPTQDLGFLGYSLPEEESTSQATLTKVPTHTTVVRRGSFPNAPKLELNLDGGELGDWSSLSEYSATLDDLENFGF